ncbi:MAG: ABC transporter permease [Roseiflexus sp.]|jgi:rhamnose transport system permease protein|nr:ABC transporter permease [Roseiflexus sp.]
MPANLRRLIGWEGLLLCVLALVVVMNTNLAPAYLSLANQINLFQLSIEKIIVALVMTFVIINGEIDLSVASVMGLAACLVAVLFESGTPMALAILAALLVGALCGAFNGFWVAYVGLPSLAVTLAGMIGFRGVARILIEDRSIGGFPEWFTALGQQPLIGPFPLSLILFALLFVLAFVILQFSGVGRLIYVVGNNAAVARYSGIDTRRLKLGIFIASGLIASLAGILLAARLGAVRGNTAEGFELDIITMVLLGGVSIFGGTGNLAGVGLAILVILNLRNGMSLLNVTGNVQTGVIGMLLILSVLIPNLAQMANERLQRRIAPRKEAPIETESSVSS